MGVKMLPMRASSTRIVYGNNDMYVDASISKEQVLDSMVEVFAELNTVNTYIEERYDESGRREWHVIKRRGVSLKKKDTSYFSYLLVNDVYHFIKDMHLQEVAKKIMQVKIGDMFDIKGLGALQVVNVYHHPFENKGEVITEIGLICNRVDS
jgi:hypothetical protein